MVAQIVMSVVMRKEQLEIPTASDLPGGTFSNLADYVSLVRRCLSHDVQERPTFGRIIKALRGILDQCMAETGAKHAVTGECGPSLWTAASAPPIERQLGSGSASVAVRRTSGPLDSKHSQHSQEGGEGMSRHSSVAGEAEAVPSTAMNASMRPGTPPPPSHVEGGAHVAASGQLVVWQHSTSDVSPAFPAMDLPRHPASDAGVTAVAGAAQDFHSTSYVGWSFQNTSGSLCAAPHWAVGELSPGEELCCHPGGKPPPLQEPPPPPPPPPQQQMPSTGSRSDLTQVLAKYIRKSQSAKWEGAAIPVVRDTLERPVAGCTRSLISEMSMMSSLPMSESRTSSAMFAIGTIDEDAGNDTTAGELPRADRGGAVDWAAIASGGAADEGGFLCGISLGDSSFSSCDAVPRGGRFSAGDGILSPQRWRSPTHIGEFMQGMGSPPLPPPLCSSDAR